MLRGLLRKFVVPAARDRRLSSAILLAVVGWYDIAKKGRNMNLTLGFPEPAQERMLAKRTGLAGAIARFEEWMANPDSPVRAIRHQPARAGEFADFPDSLAPSIQQGLAARGVRQLYTHQAAAYGHASQGRNVVIVTPTASGKTLCYNLPVLNRLLTEPGARAMYLFPTKALAEDQLQEFQAAVDAMGSDLRAFTYDGDTPQDARRAIRERANVIFTNPDMLHAGILPHHTKWAKVFENLRYVVIDELHYYRGVYGSHLANILRKIEAGMRVLRIVATVHMLLGDHRESEGIGGGIDGAAFRAGRPERRSGGRKICRFL